MSSMYPLPPILNGSPEQQLAQLRDYLVRMARRQGAESAQTSAGQTAAVSGGAPPGKTAQSVEEARKQAAALRALIVKTADKQAADKEELELKIEGIDGTFFYIKYSPVANPTAEQMTNAPDDDTAYMGVCSTNQDTAPTDPEAYVWSRILGEDALTLQIVSSNGSIFKNGSVSTALSARVFRGDEDVTDEYSDNDFRWTRRSEDAAGDAAWNSEHFGGTKSVTILPADVQGRATFFCELVDE